MVQKIKDSGTTIEKSLLVSLETYVSDMAPRKPVDIKTGARHQYSLWRVIRTALETVPAEDFKKCWNLILAFFKEYEDASFHDRYVFRFADQWVQSDKELLAFQSILNMIKLTADPATRAANLKKVDMKRTLEIVFSDVARQRVQSFYKV